MGWVKIEDKYARNPKMMRAGAVALALDVSGMGYCREHNTNGFVSESVLPSLGPVQGAAIRKAIAALVAEGRWLRDDELAGWWIHDFLEFNPSDEEDRLAAEQRSEQARKAALARWGKRAASNAPASNEQCETGAAGFAPPMPPSPPPPKEVINSSSSSRLVGPHPVEEDERLSCCWQGFAKAKLQHQRDRGKAVGDERAWLSTVAARAREERYEETVSLIETFPDITLSQIVSVLMGDKGVLRYLRRAS